MGRRGSATRAAPSKPAVRKPFWPWPRLMNTAGNAAATGSQLSAMAPRACRAFQGWRYFKGDDAPPDLAKGDTGDMPKEMADELKRLGLL